MPPLRQLLQDIRDPSQLTPLERDDTVKGLVEKCGYAAAALTVIPIPFTELGVIPLHATMVVAIGRLYGEDPSQEATHALVARIGATVGISWVGSRVAISAVKTFFPGSSLLGASFLAAFMFASTLALGAVARAYYEREGELSDDEIREIYKSSLKHARKDFVPDRVRAADAQELAREAAEQAPVPPAEAAAHKAEDTISRLERLKEMRDRGLLEEGELEEAKRRILNEG